VKVLVSGCSFAEDLTPIIKKHIPDPVVVNLAQSGVGNRYIADSVVMATAREKFDLVYVSWTGLSRYDVCVSSENKELFKTWAQQKFLFDKYLPTCCLKIIIPLWIMNSCITTAY
jgi:hypothetical protein